MKVYLIGPMTGIDGNNFCAFDEAKELWEKAGHTVVSPADLFRAAGFRYTIFPNRQEKEHFMRADASAMSLCDAVVLLPGWKSSSGSTVEVALAQYLAMPIFDAVTRQQITVVEKPWSHFYREQGSFTFPK
jgi:nucleoside 2-deoxyribosyltransferase